jgi:putative endonuclease
MFYTYVLELTNSRGRVTYYVGFTTNLRKRLVSHKSKSTESTKDSQIKLVYYEACLSEEDARRRELSLKTGFGRAYIKNRLKSYLTSGYSSLVE